MKKLFAAACCLLLTGCAGFAYPGLSGSAPMESGAQTYAPETANGFEPAPAGNQLTSSCTMKGQGVVCR